MAGALSVGLVGAGPWAQLVHAPVLAAGPETTLAGVWSRTATAAEALAASAGVPAFARYEELLDACEVVAFAVPPSVQPVLATRAALADKALLLEKPLADDVDGAERLADAVGAAGVGSLVVLTYRFAPEVQAFVDDAAGFDAFGGRACFCSGAMLEGPFATGWRLERGALLDVGPHAVDLIDVALGPVVGVRAGGDPLGWVSLVLEHESGAVSDVGLTCRSAIEPSRTEVEIFGPQGSLAVDARAAVGADTFAELRRRLAEVARAPGLHPLDVHRGLHLQRILARAEADLAGR